MAKQPAWVDSVYTQQAALYKNALDKFYKENKRQKSIVTGDYNVATAGVARNRNTGLTSLNEDFAARGMQRGGARGFAHKEAGLQYDRQQQNVEWGKARGIQEIDAQKEKYESDNAQQVAAAQREAYARLAARQKLV